VRTVRVMLVLVSLFAATTARSDDAADSLIERGVELRKAHRDAEALEQFRRAQAVRASARTQAQIALAEQALGKWVDAERDLVAALASTDDPWIASRTAGLRAALESIRGHLGTLVVRTNVPSAELWLNGERMGELPMDRVRVAAGKLDVRVQASGHQTATRTLDLEGGTVLTADVLLVPESASAVPGADSSPPVTRESPTPESRFQRTMAWSTLAGAGLALGGALVAQTVQVRAASRYDDDALCAIAGHSRDELCGVYRGRAETAQVVADVGYIAAGGLAIASTIFFFADARRSAKHPADRRIFFVAHPSGAGIVGSF
jgi:hypothetical protein